MSKPTRYILLVTIVCTAAIWVATWNRAALYIGDSFNCWIGEGAFWLTSTRANEKGLLSGLDRWSFHGPYDESMHFPMPGRHPDGPSIGIPFWLIIAIFGPTLFVSIVRQRRALKNQPSKSHPIFREMGLPQRIAVMLSLLLTMTAFTCPLWQPTFLVDDKWNLFRVRNGLIETWITLPNGPTYPDIRFQIGGASFNFMDAPFYHPIRTSRVIQLAMPYWMATLAFIFYPTLAIWWANRKRKLRPDIACDSCGYDLTGNTTGRCPECNTDCASTTNEKRISRTNSPT